MDAPVPVGKLPEIMTKVLDVREEGARAKTFRLSVPADFSFSPGMWVMLQFADKAEHASAYSISSSPFERGYIEISLCNVGALTERLFALDKGATLLMHGPYGKWIYSDDVRHAVLISDGTGITPFRSMARYVLDRKLPNKITLLYSARTPDAFLYEKDLERFSASGIRVFKTVTHPEEAPQSTWTGARGAIDIGVVMKEVGDFTDAVFYLCGPRKLVEELTDGLLRNGVPRNNIRTEKWGDYTWV